MNAAQGDLTPHDARSILQGVALAAFLVLGFACGDSAPDQARESEISASPPALTVEAQGALPPVAVVAGAAVGDEPAQVVSAFYDRLAHVRVQDPASVDVASRELAAAFFVPADDPAVQAALAVAVTMFGSEGVCVDFSNIRFEELQRSGDTARVRLSGDLVVQARGASEVHALNEVVDLVRVEGSWKMTGFDQPHP